MLTATLYQPHYPPRTVPTDGLVLPNPQTGFAAVTEHVSALLECGQGMVDVLASGPAYVVYTVFDCEGPVNEEAMMAVTAVSKVKFELTDEDSVLCGPVLIVQQ